MRRGSVIVWMMLGSACTPTVSPPPPPPAALEVEAEPATPEPDAFTISSVSAPGDQAPDLRATAVDCSWGSTGVVPAEGPVPYWVMGVVQLHPDRVVEGVTLRSVEVFGDDGRALGRAEHELSLREVASDATVWAPDDQPFSGRLDADRIVRLRFRARLPDAFASHDQAPARYQLTLDTAAGAIVRISGAVGSAWPTA